MKLQYMWAAVYFFYLHNQQMGIYSKNFDEDLAVLVRFYIYTNY